MSDWKVGEIYGKYEVVELTPEKAVFKLPDGSTETYPNIFQAKTDRQDGILKDVKPARKPALKKLSEDELQAELAQAKAKLDAIKAKRQALVG